MNTIFALLLITSSAVFANENNSIFFLSANYDRPFGQHLKGPIVGVTAEAKSFISFIPKLQLQRNGSPVLGCTGVTQLQGDTLVVSKFKVCIRSLDRVALYRNKELSPSEIKHEEALIRDAMEARKFATPQEAPGKVYWNKSGPAEVPVHHPSTRK